jgi:alkaline phosphatase D
MIGIATLSHRRLRTFGLLVAGLLCAGCSDRPDPDGSPLETADAQAPTAGINAEPWVDAPYVVLVSFDGFASRYVDQLQPSEILEMAEAGIWASDGMLPVYPSKTFPNHYSLVTGSYPARHGIVGNTFYDPARDALYRIGDRDKVEDGTWYGAEPIWVTAERQGMVAASFFWVGSEADVSGIRPSYWRRYDESISNEARVRQVVDWLSYPAERRPHVVTLYFSLVDNAGHEFGPESQEVVDAVAEANRIVEQLREGLAQLPHADRVTLIVTADHGMDGYTADHIEYVADALPSLEGVRPVEMGPNGTLFVEGGRDEAVRVRDAINAGLEHVTAYLTEDTPDHLHYRGNDRIGDLVLMPDSGWVVFPENDRPARPGFTHGWDPRITSMRALFVAEGAGLPAGVVLDPFENVQVYPLVTRLLGLAPAEMIDGDPAFWDSVVRD